MIVSIIFVSLTFAFILYCAVSALRKFIGYNPSAPSLRERWKAWIKRNIVDDGPIGEDHARGRYPTLDEVNERRRGEK